MSKVPSGNELLESFLKAIKGPDSEEEAIELVKNNEDIKNRLELTAMISALLHVLIVKELTTEKEFEELKELYLDKYYKIAAQQFMDYFKKEEDEEDD